MLFRSVILLSLLIALCRVGLAQSDFGYPCIPNPDWTWAPTQPTLPSPWSSEQAGFYYVNNQTGTDTGRTYGAPATPRATIPSSLAAGSVVVVAGTYSGAATWNSNGTASDRIWIIAADQESKPIFTQVVTINGDYYMVDGLKFQGVDGSLRMEGSYYTFLNCEGSDTDQTNGSCISGFGDHIVWKDGIVGPVGDYQYSGPDIDHHGWKLRSSYTWVMDSTFYRCQGDGIQVGDTQTVSSHTDVYIAGCTAYENLQTGIWLKNVTRAIVAHNVIHTHLDEGGGSVPAGTGGQYDFDRGVFFGNAIYNCKAGIQIQSDNVAIQGPRYIIGNRIYATTGYSTTDPHQASAIVNRGGVDDNCYILYNTLYNNAGGINVPNANTTTIYGNIVELPTQTGARNIYSPDTTPSLGSVDYNLYPGATQRISWGSSTIWTLAQFVANTTHGDNGVTAASAGWTDAANGDFTLAVGSAAIDSGPTAKHAAIAALETEFGASFSYDPAGVTRPQNANWDLGAYEYQAAAEGDNNPKTQAAPKGQILLIRR